MRYRWGRGRDAGQELVRRYGWATTTGGKHAAAIIPADLRWLCRAVWREQVDHHWSEDRPGKWPCVEVWLHEWSVDSWGRDRFQFWTVDVAVQFRQVTTDVDRPFNIGPDSTPHATLLAARRQFYVASTDLRPQIR
jgi:hypothetical protein